MSPGSGEKCLSCLTKLNSAGALPSALLPRSADRQRSKNKTTFLAVVNARVDRGATLLPVGGNAGSPVPVPAALLRAVLAS